MIALISGAWWASKLAGVTAQAAALAVGAAVVVSVVVGGLTWLRHDARMDERAGWETRVAEAKAAAEAEARKRVDASEQVAAAEAAKWLVDFKTAEAARMELETRLAALKERPVCFTADMVGVLNR